MKKILLLLSGLTLIILFYSFSKEKQNSSVDTPSNSLQKDEILRQSKYDYLKKNSLQIPLSQQFVPIHIFYDAVVNEHEFTGYWNASGVAVVQDGKVQAVITAGHVFNKAQNRTYHCVPLIKGPWPKIFALETAEKQMMKNPKGEMVESDVALAFPGKVTRIKGFSSFSGGNYFEANGILSRLKEKFSVRSLVTGDVSEVIGSCTLGVSGYDNYFVFIYDVVPSESGTGFISADNFLIILSGGMDLDDNMRKILGLTAEHKKIGFGLKVKPN